MFPDPAIEYLIEAERLRLEYNAAIANGLILRARQIERRLNAMTGMPLE